MKQVLVYSDSLTWGIIPNTRRRLPFDARWPGVMEIALVASGYDVRVIEDCLNGRRTVFEDPYKPGRNGLAGIEQRIEIHSPLALVIVMLGTNDFQSMHVHNAWHAAEGVATIVRAIRRAPIEPGMPVPEVLVVAPSPIRTPKGPIAPKFAGADTKCSGLAAELQRVTNELGCRFFDAGTVTASSEVDGIHLDAAQHAVLGRSLANIVAPLLAAAGA
jgi:lysophospholipase L1-like esterase